MADFDDEADLFKTLETAGLECGVHDPDFDEPIDSTLHLEAALLSEHSLRLECEDPSLSFTDKLSRIQVAANDGVSSGYGVAIMVDGAPGAPAFQRVLVIQTADERDCLVSMLRNVKDDPRFYRPAQSLLGCIPIGCLCGGSKKKPDVPERPSSPTSRASGDDADMNHSPSSKADISMASTPSIIEGGKRKVRNLLKKKREQQDFRMTEAKQEAQRLWDQQVQQRSSSASTASARRSSFSLSGRIPLISRTSSAKDLELDIADRRSGSESIDAFQTLSGSQIKDFSLDKGDCSMLLLRLLYGDGAVDPAPSGHHLFEGMCSQGADQEHKVEFEDFWSVCHVMLLGQLLMQDYTQPFCTEPDVRSLQTYLEKSKDGSVMSLERFEWFLVQIQDEDTKKIKKASALFQNLPRPERNEHNQMTLYGFSRYLCSDSNSLVHPKALGVFQDMTRPLSEYWIATTHHVYGDAKPGCRQGRDDIQQSPKDDLGSISALTEKRSAASSFYESEETTAADVFMVEAAGDQQKHHKAHTSALRAGIRGGCRALGLLLVSGSSGRVQDEQLHVIFQQNRVPLDEVLQHIEDEAFKKEPAFPLLLVLSLALLTPASAAEVPQVLFDGLGDRLWTNVKPELPSPQAALGKVIVLLAPMARSGDVFSDLSLRQLPPAALTKWPKDQSMPSRRQSARRPSTEIALTSDDPPDMMEEWQSQAKNFAIWPGCTFDASLPNHSQHEVSVGFVPADELQGLEDTKLQSLIEYHRRYLTQSYPVASRCTPTNCNPAIAWSMGVQMSAMMMRGAGSSALLAHAGRFAQDNGGCGYVLKPKHLRIAAPADEIDNEMEHHEGDDSKALMDESVEKTLTMRIRVLAARAVVPSRIGAHVSLAISVCGATADCRREVYRPVSTACPWSPGSHGGHVVEWAEGRTDTITFVVRSPSTAILVFEVSELDMQEGSSWDLAGFAAPLNRCREGIRWVPLWAPGKVEACATQYGALCGLLVHTSLSKGKPSRGTPAASQKARGMLRR